MVFDVAVLRDRKLKISNLLGRLDQVGVADATASTYWAKDFRCAIMLVATRLNAYSEHSVVKKTHHSFQDNTVFNCCVLTGQVCRQILNPDSPAENSLDFISVVKASFRTAFIWVPADRWGEAITFGKADSRWPWLKAYLKPIFLEAVESGPF